MSKSFTRGELDKALDAAPRIVQDALVTDPYLDFVLSLQSTYQLHVDIAGTVTEQMRNLLLGLINPTEFVQNLQELGISAETVRQLTTDLNAKVFLPLQQSMREEADGSLSQSAPIKMPVLQAIPVPVPILVPAPAPEVQAPSAMPFTPTPPSPPPFVPPSPRPQAEFASVPAYTPATAAPSFSVSEFAKPQEFIRTMNTDLHAVQEHQAPEMQPFAAPQAPRPAATYAPVQPPARLVPPSAPLMPQQPIVAPLPKPVVPPPQVVAVPVPQQPRPIVAPVPQNPQPPRPQSVPVPAPAANANRDALHAVLKEYGVDPYREPVE